MTQHLSRIRSVLQVYWPLFLVFLLPWQAMWLLSVPVVHGFVWDQGVLRVSLIALMVVIFVFVCVFLKWLRGASVAIWKSRSLYWALFGMVLWVGVQSVWIALDTERAFLGCMHLIAAGGVGWFLYRYSSVVILRGVFVFTLCVQSVFALSQFVIQFVFPSSFLGIAGQDPSVLGVPVVIVEGVRYLRAFGSFPHPNILGAWIAVSLLFTVHLWVRAHTRSVRLMSFFAFGIQLIGLLVTFSRSAIFAVLLGLGVYVGGVMWQKVITPIQRVYGGLFVVLFIVILMPFTAFYVSRVDTSQSLEQRSISERSQYFSDGVQVWRDHFLLGTGLGNSTHSLRRHYPEREGYALQPVHIAGIVFVIEMGVIGVLLFFSLLFFFWRTRSRKQKEGFSRQPLFLAMLLVLFVVGAFDHFLWTLWPGMVLGASGIVLAIER